MRTAANHLRLIGPPSERADGRSVPARGDVALLASLLAVNLVPIVGEVARIGSWGPGTVGLATAGALLAGRELGSELRALLRASSR